jgi:uncharacterized protein
MAHALELTVLADAYSISRLAPEEPLPGWILEPGGIVAVTRTDEELSIVCRTDRIPAGQSSTGDYRGLRVHGPLPLETVGIMAALSGALAAANVSLLAVSTHDTDYLFVPARDIAKAVRALRHEGHTVHTP